MEYFQNTITGEVVSENEHSYAAAQKGNWVPYVKIPRYTIETPPYARGRAEFDEDGKFCCWDDVKDIIREHGELAVATDKTPAWQSIVSGPEDGTAVLGYVRLTGDLWMVCPMYYTDGGWKTLEFYCSNTEHHISPTHWMPLPEPPK